MDVSVSSDKNSPPGLATTGGSAMAVMGLSDDGDSDESTRDDESKASLEELDAFLKQAENESGENLSDQTPGGICLYDCSLSTPTDKSLSHFSRTFNDVSECNPKNIHDLSCSMLANNSHCMSRSNLEDAMNRISTELQKKNEIIQVLCQTLDAANGHQESGTSKAQELTDQVSLLKENFEDLTNFSQWSLDDRNGENTSNSLESFRLSSYIRKIASQNQPSENQSQSQNGETVENRVDSRSIQTSPVPVPCTNGQQEIEGPQFDINLVKSICWSFLSTARGLKEELNTVRKLIKQPYENHRDFPIHEIRTGLQEIIKCHETEVSAIKQQLSAEQKHHHEVQNTLKDEIKTMKMRLQEKIKQRDSEVAELRARLFEASFDTELHVNENLNANSVNTDGRPVFDESFNSNSEEETFSNLTRTKVEYLKLTPSEYVEDEIIDAVHIPDSYRQILEDYKLKLFDMEKKFDANRRYLEEQTHDREVERDEFQHALESLQNQIEDLKKENGKLYEINKQNVYQMEEYDTRLKSAEEDEMDMIQKHEKTEDELKAAVEKIFELREIIRDLEKQVDSLSTCAIQLKEQNQVLLDELEKQEVINKKEQPVFSEQDTYGTLPMDVTDEIQAQLHDLARKIEFKITEMDNLPLHTRPNSSCSGVASAVSTEDISCRELAGRSSRNFEHFPIEDIGSLLLNEIRRLESQFESLIRFEDVVMKKLKDSDLRCSGQKGKIEELEAQVSIYQEKCSNQMLKIADLEGKIDALRFESSNQGIISTLKSRLGAASKQMEEYKIVLASKEQELSQIKLELNTLKIKQVETVVEKKEMSSQTYPLFEGSDSFIDFTHEGVSPEKIRRMDSINPMSTSVMSFSHNIARDKPAYLEADLSQIKAFDPMNRTGMSTGSVSERSNERSRGRGFGDGDNLDNLSYETNESRENTTIKEMDDNLHELQRLLTEKDKVIHTLQKELSKIDPRAAIFKKGHDDGHGKQKEKWEEENKIDSRAGIFRKDHDHSKKDHDNSGKDHDHLRKDHDHIRKDYDHLWKDHGKQKENWEPENGIGSRAGIFRKDHDHSGKDRDHRKQKENWEAENEVDSRHSRAGFRKEHDHSRKDHDHFRKDHDHGKQKENWEPENEIGSRAGIFRKDYDHSRKDHDHGKQRESWEPENEIDSLTGMSRKDHNNGKQKEKCEEENVSIEMDLSHLRPPTQRDESSEGEPSTYEATYATEYEVDGDLLRYIGTRLLSEGIKKDTSLDHGPGRVQETNLQIEIATLNTQIQQLKRALDEERKKSDNLAKQLKSCEEAKAELRSRSPAATANAPVQKASNSDLKMQHRERELAHQVEEGRTILNITHKEIKSLNDQINQLEAKLNSKLEYEQELLTRLNSTSSSLRRCEEHGRDLSSKNLENIKEIRRLREQLDRLQAISRNSENYPVSVSGNGNEYFEHFMRAKSHKKALAWQKKYLASVIIGYKSILRQVGHGNEHPELIQTYIPIAPSAVGLLDKRSHKTNFRVGALAVLAVIRMKYMVNRWYKKRTAEGSPDSEYNVSRHTIKIDPNIIRPKGILKTHPAPTVLPFSVSSAAVVNNNTVRPDSMRNNVGDISDYLNRFESIENEISNSLSRNLFPS